MRILLLACLAKNTGGNIFGGAEKSITNLANWLANNTNNEIMLASVEGDSKPFPISNKVIYRGFEFEHRNKAQIHFQIYKNTKIVINDFRPDKVISFWIQPLFYYCLTGNSSDYFYSERNDPSLEYGKIAKIMRSFILRRAKGVIFQTNDAMNYFPNNIQKKSVVIHNPVYIKYGDYPIKENRDKRIVSVGRLNEQKNYSLLIDAFSRICDDYTGWTLEIYGEGILREQLQEKINAYGLEDRISLMGAHHDVIDRIYGAGLFVMTSYYEGMPNALMEAMCLGIPVICSDCPCGGPRELIENGLNGYLFKNNDCDDLINKMRIALSSPWIDQLIKNEKELCNTHSQDEIFRKWYEFIHS